MAKRKSSSSRGVGQDKPIEPLLRALGRSGIGGFPMEIWLTIANATAPEGVRYQAADAEAVCRKHPDQVSKHRTRDEFRYQPARGTDAEIGRVALSVPSIAAAMETALGPFPVEDDIAVALVALWDEPASDPGVREYLQRCLPAQCADGTGRGIEALRAKAGDPEIALLLAEALRRRATRLPSTEKTQMLREAVELFADAGNVAESAKVRLESAGALRAAGDLDGAIQETSAASDDLAQLALRAPFQVRFVAAAQLDLGRLCAKAGRRREARAATKNAVRMFERVAAEDHRFFDEVRLSQRQLRRLRWRRPVD